MDWAAGVFFLPILVVALLTGRASSAMRKWIGRRPKIIWGPVPILTIVSNSQAERELGYHSRTLVYSTYYLLNNFDYNLEKWVRIRMVRPIVEWWVFLWALVGFDIFHFFFDRGFLNPHGRRGINRLELPLLKMAGKAVIVSAYGGDVRYETKCRMGGEYNCCTDCDQRLRACICDEGLAVGNFKYVSRYADVILSMGDMIEYTPGSKNDVFYWSIDVRKIGFVGVKGRNDAPIVIVHAPNHRQFKGTKHLIGTVEKLKVRGYPVELRLVEGVRNDIAIEIYKEAEIVVEQLLIGWHGYLAVECLALGKPVVAFIRKPDVYLPKGYDCPIVSADPDNLEERLCWLIENPDVRVELGIRGRRYVEEVFSMESVGKRLDGIYQAIWPGSR